ncbi:nucleoside phosphorylase [Pedobacter heparinus]|uniref:Purine or other phosphorylase family 1 n=1 Tax=Pedobacter heparinus (strain ATCC 13125 / DSM 2366 / CIP 104194 / JCM 7457 / NBRC 12017 / NCIMB 9290 / NRRL B-14731 / HIM 762-3) TaxID=485917 RepID=C6XXW6_PEDHD|nr:nucleoside phosphorylase [Pedobacter heparinus]ACU04384.1 purine or other phosphorylase family 1 [Pedobacter heparinus DSM 2366]
MAQEISAADLIINPDGSIYHLNLLPGDIAETIITVGDPDRVSEISRYFDSIELKKGKREFITHTGYLGKKRLTVVSTGIGTDNIDIVFNELDALVNIDFQSRKVKEKLSSLKLIRIGTSGAIQADIPMGTILASSFGIGMDALMNYYIHELSGDEHSLLDGIKTHFSHYKGINPYITAADKELLNTIGGQMQQGITLTAPGFYAPQGRQVRAKNAVPDLISQLQSFRHNQYRITNLEMETAGIYALARVLGHKALSVNAILASRVNFQFSPDPQKVVNKAIKMVLDQL